jgi:hypothetical protein
LEGLKDTKEREIEGRRLISKNDTADQGVKQMKEITKPIINSCRFLPLDLVTSKEVESY